MPGRTYRRRWTALTLEELGRVAESAYVVAKCDINTEAPSYPCRPSETRIRTWKSDLGLKRIYEHPNMDDGEWSYPTGVFTTWLKTTEVKELLTLGKIIRVHEAIIAFADAEHKQKWSALRKQAFALYGKRCMRCGESVKALEVDHVEQWANRLELRYDIGNLQILCVDCHRWKTEQERWGTKAVALDFRITP